MVSFDLLEVFSYETSVQEVLNFVAERWSGWKNGKVEVIGEWK